MKIASRSLLSRFSAVLTLAGALALGSTAVQAHDLWIEDLPDKQLVLRFAEPGEEFEKSPGYLDALTEIYAWTPVAEGKNTNVVTQKKSDHFVLVSLNATNQVQAETGFPIRKMGDKPGRKPFFYVRWQPAGAGAGKPSLNLDIVPTGKPGEAQVFLRQKPLPSVKLTLHTPDGKSLEVAADDKGIVHYTADKPGLYLLALNHYREDIAGYFAGTAFDQTSHNSVLSWRQP